MKRSLLITALLVIHAPASAGEIYEFYNGVRALGMGGAGVAVVNDETALLVNPAGLGKLRDYYITVADPELEGGSNSQKLIGTDVMGVMEPQKALTRLTPHPDKHLHEKAQVFPSIVVPNFGFGLYGRWQVDAQIDSASNTFTYDYLRDYTLVFGFNFRLWNGIIKLGAVSRVTDRLQIRRSDLDPAATDLTTNDLAGSGMGVASDAGLMLSAPVAWLPTLAATYHDMGRTAYTWRSGSTATANTPDSTPETIDVALAIHPILGKRFRSTWTAQYNDIMTYSDETDQMRRVHAGVEFNYADALFLRAGMNQRYWTAGVELAIVNYQFQAATYGEDIGTAGSPKEDRRYVAKFSFRF
ncbi:MAG: hypothetical protein KF799_08630 [Bdellovibrionales bacterium]|nr:hypothetical protein [Bdellovibrionales bacterium]